MTHVLLNGVPSVPKIPRADVDSPSGNVVILRLQRRIRRYRRRVHESSSALGVDLNRSRTYTHGCGATVEKNCEQQLGKKGPQCSTTRSTRFDLTSWLRSTPSQILTSRYFGTISTILQRPEKMRRKTAIKSRHSYKLNLSNFF